MKRCSILQPHPTSVSVARRFCISQSKDFYKSSFCISQLARQFCISQRKTLDARCRKLDADWASSILKWPVSRGVDFDRNSGWQSSWAHQFRETGSFPLQSCRPRSKVDGVVPHTQRVNPHPKVSFRVMTTCVTPCRLPGLRCNPFPKPSTQKPESSTLNPKPNPPNAKPSHPNLSPQNHKPRSRNPLLKIRTPPGPSVLRLHLSLISLVQSRLILHSCLTQFLLILPYYSQA